MVGRLLATWRVGPSSRTLCALFLALLLLFGMAASTHPAFADETTIGRIAVTSVDDRSFAVSWITDQPAGGFVRYGTDRTRPDKWTRVDDVRGSGYSGYTHYVGVENGDPGRVDPSTTYYFSVTSGQTTIVPSGQGSQMVRTGATLAGQAPPPNFFSAIVRYADAAPASGVLVFVNLGRVVSGRPTVTSQQLTGLTDNSGAFSIDVSRARIDVGGATGGYFRLSPTSPDEQIIYELDAGQGNQISGIVPGNATSAGSAAPVQPRLVTMPVPPELAPTPSPTSGLVLTPPPPVAPTVSPEVATARPGPQLSPTPLDRSTPLDTSTPLETSTPLPPSPTSEALSPVPAPATTGSPSIAVGVAGTAGATPTAMATPTPPSAAPVDESGVPPSIFAVIGVAVLCVTTGLALTAVGLLEASRRR